MYLNITLSNANGFSPEELRCLVAFFRENFDKIVLPEKQSIVIRIYSRLFLAKHGRMGICFSHDNDITTHELEMAAASLKMDLSDFEKMASELFQEESFEFSLLCEGPGGLKAKLDFEKCGAENNPVYAFIESDNKNISPAFSRAFTAYALDRKHLRINTDQESFLMALKLVRDESEAQFERYASA